MYIVSALRYDVPMNATTTSRLVLESPEDVEQKDTQCRSYLGHHAMQLHAAVQSQGITGQFFVYERHILPPRTSPSRRRILRNASSRPSNVMRTWKKHGFDGEFRCVTRGNVLTTYIRELW